MKLELLTAEQAAARIRVCTKTLGRLRRAGKIRFYATGGRAFHYSEEDCDAYLASCQVLAQVRAPEPEPVKGRRTARVIPLRPKFSEAYG
ncbi:helix-turn-helix domain-containing protein [Sandarakinorhabdus sp. DWP1-3-1]|uniref:helix-turn-helix domain-containing protein n=1 Tax=Sandarakinorhabdus sp. DWP1-3-1 TaxID=2804627 RepID=UPI003CF6A5EF